MNREMIKRIIQDQADEREAILKNERLIEREQQEFWKKYIDNDLVKVTAGVRRSGSPQVGQARLRGLRGELARRALFPPGSAKSSSS